eukprot:gene1334-4515_t
MVTFGEVILRHGSSYEEEQASQAFKQDANQSVSRLLASVKHDSDIAFITWPDDCVYVGEVKANIANGFGMKTSPDGWLYCGQWQNGKEQGLGFYAWSDGSWYAGEWIRGKADGRGVWTGLQGVVYSGEWTAGQKNRLGKQTWTNHPKQVLEYIGMWRNGSRSGLGVEIDKCKQFLVFRVLWFQQYTRHLSFLLISTNFARENIFQHSNALESGGHFAGQFSDKGPNGVGKRIIERDSTYSGDWEYGLKNGYGIEISPSGNYTGHFVANARNGFGISRKGTTVIRGKWKNNFIHKYKFAVGMSKNLKHATEAACEAAEHAEKQYKAAWMISERGNKVADTAMNILLQTRLLVCLTLALLEPYRLSCRSTLISMDQLPRSFHRACLAHYKRTKQHAIESGTPFFLGEITLSELQLDDGPSIVTDDIILGENGSDVVSSTSSQTKVISSSKLFSEDKNTDAAIEPQLKNAGELAQVFLSKEGQHLSSVSAFNIFGTNITSRWPTLVLLCIVCVIVAVVVHVLITL